MYNKINKQKYLLQFTETFLHDFGVLSVKKYAYL